MKVRHNLPNELELGKAYEFKLEKVGDGVIIPPDGTLLRKKDDYKVWWMQGEKRRWIATLEVFKKMEKDLGFTNADILIIEPGWKYDPTTLEDIPEGKPIEDWPEDEPELEPEDVVKMILAYLPMGSMRLEQAKELGFNSMHSYTKNNDFWRDHLNYAASLGMRCLITLPDNATAREVEDHVPVHRNHAGLWGWLTFDDADWRCSKGDWTLDDMRRVYNDVKRYDDKHPVALSVCHGASDEDHDWNKYLAFDSFDVLFYQLYAYKGQYIPDPEKWLKWMFDRLADYPQLEGKRIIPVIQTFERGIFDDPTGKIKHVYEMARERLGRKSSSCYDWDGLVNYAKYHPEVKQINGDL